MGLVRMDVDEVAAIIASLRGVLETCFDEWSDVGTASSRALHSCDAMGSALSTHLPALSDLALDLQRRRDLAILLNSDGGSMPTGVLEYTAPGDDSSAAVTAALGKALADFARRDEAREDPEAMAALEAMLDTYSGQPEVLSAFYTELGPSGLLDVMASLSGPYAEFGSDEYNQRASLLAEIKSGFATAERTWGDAQSAQYAKDLVDLASGTVDRPSSYPFGFGGALSYLLYDSHYSDAFLTSAASQIDHHERTTFGGYSSSGSSWTSGGGPNPWYAYFPEDGQVGSYDLGVSLMSALGNNAEVGLDFFMDGNQDGQVTDRQMYWLHTREWEQDQFSHLSQALLAATTDPRLIQPWDSATAHDAAVLASHTVNLLGHRDGLDSEMLNGEDGNADAAGNLARILATYMVGADATLYNEEESPWNGGDAADTVRLHFMDAHASNVPVFNKASLEKFIALAASTQGGFTELRAGLDLYGTVKYGVAVEGLAGGDNERFEAAYLSQARMEGFFGHAVGAAKIQGAADDDEARQMWIDLAGEAVGLVPFGSLMTKAGGGQVAETIVSFAIDKGTAAATDQMTESWASLKDHEVDVQNKAASVSLRAAQYSLLSAMDQQGLVAAPEGASWYANGRMPTWDEFSAMSAGDRLSAMSHFRDPGAAGGQYSSTDFGEAYKNEFQKYFDE